MKAYIYIGLILIIFGLGRLYFSVSNPRPASIAPSPSPSPVVAPSVAPVSVGFLPPISDFSSRITKKPFGIRITPDTSPIQPERFSGYHTGADAEIFSGEEEIDVSVTAACAGEILSAGIVSGYGGVVVQSCVYQNQPVTVLYGHLRPASLVPAVGDHVSPGDLLGFLGSGGSGETAGERKHLHFAVHRGTGINFAGYVSSASGLSKWLDPLKLIFFNQPTD